jgi:hypothetical protein
MQLGKPAHDAGFLRLISEFFGFAYPDGFITLFIVSRQERLFNKFKNIKVSTVDFLSTRLQTIEGVLKTLANNSKSLRLSYCSSKPHFFNDKIFSIFVAANLLS